MSFLDGDHSQNFKISIFGASGIGKFHARIFDSLNLNVCSILSSSKKTGKATSKYLNDSFGIKTKYYDNIDLSLIHI